MHRCQNGGMGRWLNLSLLVLLSLSPLQGRAARHSPLHRPTAMQRRKSRRKTRKKVLICCSYMQRCSVIIEYAQSLMPGGCMYIKFAMIVHFFKYLNENTHTDTCLDGFCSLHNVFMLCPSYVCTLLKAYSEVKMVSLA